jgi:transposase InsO family protein
MALTPKQLMPWSETNVSKEKVKFVLEWERRWSNGDGVVNVTELCREFGISRECGHKAIRRYCEAGHDLRAVEEHPRRPKRSPSAVRPETEELVVTARRLRPRWGPLKLRAWLLEQDAERALPSASTIAAILKRRGLVRPAKKRRRCGPVSGVSSPFPDCDEPNAVWCVDFKGSFNTHDGKACYPLTISDAYSRYVLWCEGMREPNGRGVAAAFELVFREFGLPRAIRSDNGPPFASVGAAGLTSLSVWWLQLGLRLERIARGKPQQNGRHERMHGTLKRDVAIAGDLRDQQRAFDAWRREFNDERPHAALGQRPPARIYVASPRRYPRLLIRPEPMLWNQSARVDERGFVKLRKKRILVSPALRNHDVEFERISTTVLRVRWGAVVLGHIDEGSPRPALVLARRRRGQPLTLALT